MYQLVRNATIFNIRGVWIKTRDNRWYTYSYQHMFAPKKSNWYGLKYPTDSDYKIQKDE